MDYESLALNLPGAVANGSNLDSSGNVDVKQPNMCGGGQEILETKVKDKTRRYWSAHEEERLYEIWGRDNWRLTRNGKNTVYFGRWAEELRERFNISVKPEEIQMKVNQTRAKFRQVKKTLQNDTSGNVTRWKKFDIIDRILKNLHRPKDAEPLPPEALKNNRDISPPRTDSPTEHVGVDQPVLNLTAEGTNNVYNNSSNSNNSASNNANTNPNSNSVSYNTELFTDQYDDVKQEFEEDYPSMTFQEQVQPYSPAESTHLLELQTPQQIQQQHQEHQQQQPHFQQSFEQSVGAYSGASHQVEPHYNSNNNVSAAAAHLPITAVAYINTSNNSISVATNSNGHGVMQLPGSNTALAPIVSADANAAATPIPTPRKRGRPYGSATGIGTDSFESLYIEEVRRKNQILAEQTQISQKRLELEERKITLMSTFFPKCLEQQAEILARVMEMQSQPQPEP